MSQVPATNRIHEIEHVEQYSSTPPVTCSRQSRRHRSAPQAAAEMAAAVPTSVATYDGDSRCASKLLIRPSRCCGEQQSQGSESLLQLISLGRRCHSEQQRQQAVASSSRHRVYMLFGF